MPTKIIPLLNSRLNKTSAYAAFTLPELLVATVGGSILVIAALAAILGQINAGSAAAKVEKLRNTWTKAINFIETEISLSERIFTDPDKIRYSSSCGISSSEFRLALDITKNLPPVIYGIKSSHVLLMGDNTLWRCGPTILSDGSYSNTLSIGILADSLNASSTGSGFSASIDSNSNGKLSEMVLSLKGDNAGNFQLASNASSRISPLFNIPKESTTCTMADNFADLGNSSANSITLSSSGIACGNGGGDTINGSSGDDVLEAGDSGVATINGNDGNDFIRGTNDNDTLNGGVGDDVLVGRGGNDSMNGGAGTNYYRPGLGNDTITGSSTSLDIVFFPENISLYNTGSCSRSSCTVVSSTEGTKTMSNIKILIFKDSRVDLE